MSSGVDMSSQNAITMASSHHFSSRNTRTDTAILNDEQKQEIASAVLEAKEIQVATDTVTLSLTAEQSIQVNLLSRLFGKEIKLDNLNDLQDPSKVEITKDSAFATEQAPPQSFVREQYYFEQEQTEFVASGQITLSDGSQTQFDFAIGYQRQFESYSKQIISAEQLKDPLVINLSQQAIELSDNKIQFDLDLDGKADSIASLSSNAAFIAVDRNNNGEIDDGSELFGAKTGNGFSELAKYDDNKDGYINRDDAIFADLLLWQPGQSQPLTKLSDSQVDTLVLQSVDTAFRFTDSQNQTLGQMRRTGVYANSDGSVGALHQIDLKV